MGEIFQAQWVNFFRSILAVAHFPASLVKFRKKVIRENMNNNYSLIKFLIVMTAFNTSFFSSSTDAASREGKKGCRSSKSNNYVVDIVDFDNDYHTYEVEAHTAEEASEIAEARAMSAGVQVSYCNVYIYEV